MNTQRQQHVKDLNLDSVKASTAMATATKYIHTNIDIMCSTELHGQLFCLLQVRLFPMVIQVYAVTYVEKQPVQPSYT